MCPILRALLVSFALIVTCRVAAAIDWPNGYVTYENTESPDSRYAVFVPTLDTCRTSKPPQPRSVWSPQSRICVIQNNGRFGADSISVLQINDSGFTQTEIGDRIQKSLDGVMKKQAHDQEMSGDVSPRFRFGTDGKLFVRALSQNNPKQFDDVKTYYA